MRQFLKSSVLIAILALLLGLYLFSLYQRDADIDDAWIGEPAYWLAKDGHARSELMRGITAQEDYLIVHHKLLTLHGAAFIKIFGFSLPVLKSVSLLYFIVFIVLFTIYLKRKALVRPEQWLLGMVILFSFPWTFKYSFVFRPEIMVMTLTFSSWIFLEKVLHGSRRIGMESLLAGLLSGLCFSAHLNGIIVAMAGFFLLLLYKKYLPLPLFSLGALLGALPYFYDFNSAYGWDLWWYQLSESPALDSLPQIHPLLQPLVNLLNEHQRFFHNPKIAFFSIFIITTLVVGFRWLIKHRKPMLVYTLLLALFLGITAMHKSRQYLLVYLPFLLVMVTDVYVAFFRQENKSILFQGWRNNKITSLALILVLFIFIASGFYYNLTYSLKKFSPKDNAILVGEYMDGSPDTLKIVAPMTFIFNEIENFQRIQSEVCYTELQKGDPSVHGIGLLERTKSFDIRYVILSGYYREKLGWEDARKMVLPPEYEIISSEDDEYLVIRRK